MKDIQYEPFTVRLVGVSPILMHNVRLADPFDPIARKVKAITDNRKKTDDDRRLLSALEWAGGLYTTEKVETDERATITKSGQICIPADVIEGMLASAAAKISAKKIFQSGVMVEEDSVLEYKGPKSIKELSENPAYRDYRPAKVNRKQVMRTRPIFRSWSIVTRILYLPDVVNPSQIGRALEIGGRLVGICDYRPRFGRFIAEEVKAQ